MAPTHAKIAEDSFVAECETVACLMRHYVEAPTTLGWLRICGHLGGGCRTCHSSLLARCRRALAKYDPPPRTADADDVCQILFLKLLRHRWDPDQAPLGAWIAVIVQRIVIDEIRRADQKFEPIEDEVESPLERVVRESDSKLMTWLTPDGTAELEDLLTRVREAVEQLPFAEQQVLILHFVEGFTIREIAEVLGRSPARVFRQIHAALEGVRRLLGEGCDSA